MAGPTMYCSSHNSPGCIQSSVLSPFKGLPRDLPNRVLRGPLSTPRIEDRESERRWGWIGMRLIWRLYNSFVLFVGPWIVGHRCPLDIPPLSSASFIWKQVGGLYCDGPQGSVSRRGIHFRLINVGVVKRWVEVIGSWEIPKDMKTSGNRPIRLGWIRFQQTNNLWHTKERCRNQWEYIFMSIIFNRLI